MKTISVSSAPDTTKPMASEKPGTLGRIAFRAAYQITRRLGRPLAWAIRT